MNESSNSPDVPPLRPWRRENYIPVRKAVLTQALAAELSDEQGARFPELCRLLEATLHFEYHARLEALKNAFAPFDPDDDSRGLSEPDAVDRAALLDELFVNFSALMERANFVRLSREELTRAFHEQSATGLRLSIDLDLFDRLEVYGRGMTCLLRPGRRLRTSLRRPLVETQVYRQLVVIFRTRPEARVEAQIKSDCVYVKLFKDIPQSDVEMLLPGARVKMSRLDKGRIWLPTVSGMTMTAMKLAKGAQAVAFAGRFGVAGSLAMLGGVLGYGAKSFFGYLQTQNKYQLNLTRSLYFQNQDNNAGVLFRLLDAAEEQEFREAALAWRLLWTGAGWAGCTKEELDRQAEEWLRDKFGLDVDFEVDDALAKLWRWGLVEALAGERYRAVPIEAALARLDEAWDGYFSYSPAPAIRRAA